VVFLVLAALVGRLTARDGVVVLAARLVGLVLVRAVRLVLAGVLVVEVPLQVVRVGRRLRGRGRDLRDDGPRRGLPARVDRVVEADVDVILVVAVGEERGPGERPRRADLAGTDVRVERRELDREPTGGVVGRVDRPAVDRCDVERPPVEVVRDRASGRHLSVVGAHRGDADLVAFGDPVEHFHEAWVDAPRAEVGEPRGVEHDVGVPEELERLSGGRAAGSGAAERRRIPVVARRTRRRIGLVRAEEADALEDAEPLDGGRHQRAGHARPRLAELQRLHRVLGARELLGQPRQPGLPGRADRIGPERRAKVRILEQPLEQAGFVFDRHLYAGPRSSQPAHSEAGEATTFETTSRSPEASSCPRSSRRARRPWAFPTSPTLRPPRATACARVPSGRTRS
jgi:hypothetical protein